MPSDIWECVVDRCAPGTSLASVLLDWLIPASVEFLIFTILVSWVLTRRAKRQTRTTRQLVARRVLILTDRFLCSATPPGLGQLAPRRVLVGGVAIAIAYNGSSTLPLAYSTLLDQSIVSRTRERLNDLLSVHGGVLERDEIVELSDWEEKLDAAERTLASPDASDQDPALVDAYVSAQAIFHRLLRQGDGAH